MRCAWVVLLLFSPAFARNVDLSTVPARDNVQLTIYNAEDLTLVRETRQVTFKQGINPLQFSWANTLIDPTSVTLRFPRQAGKLEVLDTTYPLEKPQMLYWNVQAAEAIEAVVEISYFTSGITWSADYVCITDPAETVMDLTGFVRVFNNSGEEYENAQVRLVVGTINLVEKIAELAQRGFPATQPADREGGGIRKADELKTFALRVELNLYDFDGDGAIDDAGGRRPKLVQKEGLGEYFIYTVEGTETIPNGWSKRLRSFEARQIPFKVQYRYRPVEYGDQLVQMFLLKNATESKLGTTPWPDGIVRLYRDNGQNGLGFRVQQQIKYVPIGDKIELNLGPDPEVIHEWVKLKTWREHLWFQREGVNVYKEYGGANKVEISDAVVGWEDHVRYVERIRNYRAKPIEVELRRAFAGDVGFVSQLEPVQHDYQTVQCTATCLPGQKTELAYHVRTREGYLAKQQNVTIEAGE